MIRRAWDRIRHESDGYVALWTVIIAGAILTGGGYVIDLTDKANETRRVTMVANEAGRAAAQELSADVISGGESFNLDTAEAANAARSHLSAAGVEGDVRVDGTTVVITATQQWEPAMMPMPSDTLTGTSTINAEEVTAQ